MKLMYILNLLQEDNTTGSSIAVSHSIKTLRELAKEDAARYDATIEWDRLPSGRIASTATCTFKPPNLNLYSFHYSIHTIQVV